MRLAWLLVAALALGAGTGRAAEPFEAVSLLGDTLRAPVLPDSVAEERTADLRDALSAVEADPRDVDALIWLGRRLAYLGRYREAIDVYTRALEVAPRDARLYRHRGHRYLTVREFDRAVEDLESAAALIRDREDEVEPDGLPNPYGIPTSTLHFNVWYHLGLAYYLKGDFDNALRCYEECMAVSRNPDSVFATAHWQVMTLRRLGRMDEAAELVDGIDTTQDVLENEEYRRLVAMYRTARTASAVDSLYGPDYGALNSATVGYGVGCWHLTAGNAARAGEVFRRVVDVTEWAYFGHIAAEADLAAGP